MATASYPSSLKTYTDKVDNVDYVKAADINSLQAEVAAIEATLGASAGTSLLPSSAGNFAYSGGATTLAGRVQNLEAFTTNSSFYFSSSPNNINSPTTALQNVYATSGSSLSLIASTNYLIEGMLWVQISAGVSSSTTPSLQFTFTGTTTSNYIQVLETWNTTGFTGVASTTATLLDSANLLNSPFPLTASGGSSSTVANATAYCRVRYSGIVRVATAGLFTPQISLSSNSGITISTQQNSWIRATALGSGNSIGAWS